MHIKQIMTTKAATCRPESDLASVAKLMWDNDCGFVPVVAADGKVLGVLTDRDICIASATRRLLPEQITAIDAMTRAVQTCLADASIESALDAMKQARVRRLPVVGADGTLKGVVSMNDIVMAADKRQGPDAGAIVSALAGICAHRPARTAAA
ncbi:MAG: CBS domain-containing protein [Acidobacteriia bacterium]|nr:CBS domain-containing protein [Terriglobia bacterium]